MLNRIIKLVIFVALFSSQTISQESAPTDPLAFFDEHKRWYNGFTEAWFQFFDIPEKDIRRSIEHWESIGRDIEKSAGNSKAGTYATGGSTHGSFVRWSPQGGFVWLNVDKCQGGPMKILRGRVEVLSTGFAFIPEVALGGSASHEGHGPSPANKRIELVSVDWRNFSYLVRKQDVDDFSNFAAGLGEYNSQFQYMIDDPFLSKMVSDSYSGKSFLPVYPVGYEKYLKRPIRGSVISIGKGVRRASPDSDTMDEFVTPVRVRLESTQNLKVGLNLHVVDAEEGLGDIFVLKAFKENIATIHSVRSIPKKNCVVSSYDDCTPADHIKLRIGLVLSSNGF